MLNPKYPNITVQLTGEDGNAFAIMARVSKALRRADVPAEEIKKYTDESIASDFDNVLVTAMSWVDVQ